MRFRLAIASAFLVGLAASAVFAQHDGHQMSAAPAGASACAEHSRASLEIIDRAQRRLEESRQTNNPARMRSAMDDLQQALAELKTHQSLCVSAVARDAKSSEPAKPDSSPGMEMMDHSKMEGMDHSKMGHEMSTAPPKKPAQPPKTPTPPKPHDH